MIEHLNYREASDYLGLPIGTLYAMVSKKRIPHVRLSPRCVLFSKTALAAWLGERQVGVENEFEEVAHG